MSALRNQPQDQEDDPREFLGIRVAIRNGKIVRVKCCKACGGEKVVDDQAKRSAFPISRKATGNHRTYWEARCKPCHRIHRRKFRAPEKRKIWDRSYEDSLIRDPEKRATRLEQRRHANKRYRATHPRDPASDAIYFASWYARKLEEDPNYFTTAAKDARREAREAERAEAERRRRRLSQKRYPLEPFVRWLEAYKYLRRIENWDPVADELLINKRGIRRYVDRVHENVDGEVVDTALLNAYIIVDDDTARRFGLSGEIHRFDDLYPLKGES